MKTSFVKKIAFLNSVAALATAIIGIGLIGLNTMSNPELFKNIAQQSPSYIIGQDILKFILAACGLIVVFYFNSINNSTKNKSIQIAYIAGVLANILLIINALLSISSITLQNDSFQAFISLTALLSLFLNGIWYFIFSRYFMKNAVFTPSFNYLGLAIGITSIIPIFGVVALIFSIIWSLMLGIQLQKIKE